MIKGLIAPDGQKIDFGDVRKSSPEIWGLAKFPIVTSIAESQREDNGFLHVTDLVYPVRQYWLKKRHDIYVPVDALVDRWIGDCVHKAIARTNIGSHELQLRMIIAGVAIVGQIDYKPADVTMIVDCKTCKEYKAGWIRKQGIEEIALDWSNQLNLYRLLCEKNNLPVISMQVVMILKDYSPSRKATAKSYSASPIVTVNVPIDFFIEDWITNRIKALQECKDLPDDELPLCPESSRGDKDILCQHYCDCASVCDYALALTEEIDF